mgnify:CR=1 FL=1
MKKLILILTIAFISTSIFSQNANEAKTLLDEVAEKVEAYENIYIEFNHKFDNEDADVHQETRGNVTLKKELYHLNYMGTEQIFNGEKIYLIISIGKYLIGIIILIQLIIIVLNLLKTSLILSYLKG